MMNLQDTSTDIERGSTRGRFPKLFAMILDVLDSPRITVGRKYT